MSGSSNSSTLLVVERTSRPNPLNNFETYTGGWNLSSPSYFASAGYTGMPMFAITLIWIFLGFTFAIVVSCMYFCWKDHLKSNPDFGRFANWMTLISMIAFTVVTIAGCGALFTGQTELNSDLSTVFAYLTTEIAQAANASIDSVPPIAVPDTTHAAMVTANVTNTTAIVFNHTLDQIRFWVLILGSSIIAFSLIGLVFVACHVELIAYLFVIIGWAVVVCAWFLCGIFLLIYTVFGDTCAAMEEWSANPRNGTSFDLIMRCELNHTKIKGRRPPAVHTSIGQLPQIEEDAIQFPEYKLLSDSINSSPTASDDEIPFPEYDSPFDDNDIPFPAHKSVDDIPFPDYELFPEDDPNDAIQQEKQFWAQFTIQRKDFYVWDNESCAYLRASYAPILDIIVKYDCPNILRNMLWVMLAMVTLSGGCLFTIPLWIIFTRKSTMRPRKFVPVRGQLPFYGYMYEDPIPAPVPADPVAAVRVPARVQAPSRPSPKKKASVRRDPQESINRANGEQRRARREARLANVYKHPEEMSVSTKAGSRRRK